MQTTKPTFDEVLSTFQKTHDAQQGVDLEKDFAPAIEGTWVGENGVLCLVDPTINEYGVMELDNMNTKPETIETKTKTNDDGDSFSLFGLSANGKTHEIQRKFITQIEELTERTINLNEHAQMNAEYYDFPVLIDIPDSEMRFIVSPCVF